MLFALEPLNERQIQALRKVSGIATFKIFLDINDFMLDLATKGGRKDGNGDGAFRASFSADCLGNATFFLETL